MKKRFFLDLGIGRAFDGHSNPGEDVFVADGTGSNPNRLPLFISPGLADGGHPPAQDMRHIIFRAERSWDNVLGIRHVIGQAAGLV